MQFQMKVLDSSGMTKKVNIIKHLRTVTGWTLRATKDAVDEIYNNPAHIIEFEGTARVDHNHPDIEALRGYGFSFVGQDPIDIYMGLAEPLMERLKADRRMTALVLVTEALAAVKSGMA